MHNREAAKRKMGRATKATEVRCGYRAKDGTNYLFPTASEQAAHRQAELQNTLLEQQARKDEMMRKLHERMAEIDSWAKHS